MFLLSGATAIWRWAQSVSQQNSKQPARRRRYEDDLEKPRRGDVKSPLQILVEERMEIQFHDFNSLERFGAHGAV
jgi:hypothetical protein